MVPVKTHSIVHRLICDIIELLTCSLNCLLLTGVHPHFIETHPNPFISACSIHAFEILPPDCQIDPDVNRYVITKIVNLYRIECLQ